MKKALIRKKVEKAKTKYYMSAGCSTRWPWHGALSFVFFCLKSSNPPKHARKIQNVQHCSRKCNMGLNKKSKKIQPGNNRLNGFLVFERIVGWGNREWTGVDQNFGKKVRHSSQFVSESLWFRRRQLPCRPEVTVVCKTKQFWFRRQLIFIIIFLFHNPFCFLFFDKKKLFFFLN